MQQRLGLATLADFDARADSSTRSRRLANLANSLQLGTTAGEHKIVAVVGARRTARSSALASELAGLLVARQTSTVLMMTDLDVRQDRAIAGRTGLVEVLAGQLRLRAGLLRHPAGYDVLPAGQPPVGDTFAAFRPERLAEITSELSAAYDVVVVDVPPVLDASESQLICASADFVIITVDRGRTRVREVREALALLADVHAPVSGVVIDSRGVDEASATFGQTGAVAEPVRDGQAAPGLSGTMPRHEAVPVQWSNGSGAGNGVAGRPSPRPRPVDCSAGRGADRARIGLNVMTASVLTVADPRTSPPKPGRGLPTGPGRALGGGPGPRGADRRRGDGHRGVRPGAGSSAPVSGPVGMLLVAVAAAAGALVLGSPMAALLLLIFASFTRLAISIPALPAELMALAFCALVASMAIAWARGHVRFSFGWLEAAMLAYFAWNVVSAFLPHLYTAANPSTGESVVVYRFILSRHGAAVRGLRGRPRADPRPGPHPAAAVFAAAALGATRPWSASCSSPARSSSSGRATSSSTRTTRNGPTASSTSPW